MAGIWVKYEWNKGEIWIENWWSMSGIWGFEWDMVGMWHSALRTLGRLPGTLFCLKNVFIEKILY